MKMKNYIKNASLKSEPNCKLINRIPGSHLLISSLPGSALRSHVESLGKPHNLASILEALPGKLDIKSRGGSKISGKVVHMYKGVEGFALLI